MPSGRVKTLSAQYAWSLQMTLYLHPVLIGCAGNASFQAGGHQQLGCVLFVGKWSQRMTL